MVEPASIDQAQQYSGWGQGEEPAPQLADSQRRAWRETSGGFPGACVWERTGHNVAMPAICFYFQMHQPTRLRRYSVFDTGPDYFDDVMNRQIIHKVANKCYLPFTNLLKQLTQRSDSQFRFTLSMTGSLIEQLREFEPTVVDQLVELAETGCCEFLCETSHHSLAFLYSRNEFAYQIETHAMLIEDLFGQRASVFRNTELIYNNDLADFIAERTDYRGILVEGEDATLHGRSPNNLYAPPDHSDLSLLLRNYPLSDDIAFRFCDKSWNEYPLTVEKFVPWLQVGGDVVNLFMDIETFGEHQWAETGIFDFMEKLIPAIVAAGHQFMTAGEVIDAFEPIGEYDVPQTNSWADTQRDLSAWAGNAMQSGALTELYKLESDIKASDDQQLLGDWRKLTTSDHFYYMCMKYFADGDVHHYFNPYESPYDSYINFMNVLDHLRTRVGK